MVSQRLLKRRKKRRADRLAEMEYEYNRCKTCGACDGRCGMTIDGHCLNCRDTRQSGSFVLHTNLDRTEDEMKKTGEILLDISP